MGAKGGDCKTSRARGSDINVDRCMCHIFLGWMRHICGKVSRKLKRVRFLVLREYDDSFGLQYSKAIRRRAVHTVR